MAMPRLEPQWRLLAVPAAMLAGLPLVAGRFVLPWLRSIPVLGGALERQCVLLASTGVPCPFCGGTRSVELAARGLWFESLQQHPIGMVLVVGGTAASLWLLACALSGRDAGLSPTWALLVRHLSWRLLVAGLLILWLAKLLVWALL